MPLDSTGLTTDARDEAGSPATSGTEPPPPLQWAPADAVAYRAGMLHPQPAERARARAAHAEAVQTAYRERPMSVLAQVYAAEEVVPPQVSPETLCAVNCLSTGMQSPIVAHELLDQVAASWQPSWVRREHGAPAMARAEAASAIAELQPRNGAEGMLAAQAVAMHRMALRAAQIACDVAGSDRETYRVCSQAAARLAQASAHQIKVLHGLRSGGTQVIRVEQVVVQAGGQAVVGSVQSGSRGEAGASLAR